MEKKLAGLIIFIIITLGSKAGGYRIAVEWTGLRDTSVFLAHYYDSNIYINDTLQLDATGKGVFTGDSLLNEGLYMLYLNGNNYFDFLLGSDQEFSLKTVNNHLLDSLRITGAATTEKFLAYQQHIRKQSERKKQLTEKIKTDDTQMAAQARQELNELDQNMQSYMTAQTKQEDNSMYGLFLRAANPVEVPAPPVERNHPRFDSIAWFHQYFFQRDHYLDGIDFGDQRILNTPLVKPKLENYFNKVLIQSPDSIIPQAIKLLKRAESNVNTYQYVTQFLINNSSASKIMGMDAVFVAVADEVYLKGKATWADSTTLRKIAEEAYLSRPNLIGKKAPELIMESREGEPKSLHQLQADFTLLLFYETDCGHCKKEVPKIYNDFYLKNLDHNIEVYAVCMDDKRETWENFIDEHELAGWNHVWDPQHQSRFRIKYNVKTTPMIYLLDKDKMIKAKKIDIENLSKLISILLNEN